MRSTNWQSNKIQTLQNFWLFRLIRDFSEDHFLELNRIIWDLKILTIFDFLYSFVSEISVEQDSMRLSKTLLEFFIIL